MNVERKLALTEVPRNDNDSPAATPLAPVPAAATPRRSRAKVLLPILIGAAAATAAVVYVVGRGAENTDDAQVEGHVAIVAARVSGQVKRVRISEGLPERRRAP